MRTTPATEPSWKMRPEPTEPSKQVKEKMLAGNEIARRLGIHRFCGGWNRNRGSQQRNSDTHTCGLTPR